MSKKAVILCSGGLDSTTCLAMAKAAGFACYVLSFNYGQRHVAEQSAIRRIAQQWGVVEHKTINLPLHEIGGSALTDASLTLPAHTNQPDIPITYVPARNTIFLSMALAWAEVLEAYDIFIGSSSIDYSGYPDCRPDYFAAFQTLANLATKAGVEQRHFHIQTPLLYLSKAETIKRGIQLGIDFAQTISCYQATADGLACGYCDSCVIRQRGFQAAGVPDPTYYINNAKETKT